jgi:hypothetical protein
MHLAPTNIRLLVSAFLFFLALPVATEASLMRNWDWVDDPATFKPRRHLRMCVCPAEDFAIGESTLNSLTIEAATNIDSRCTGGTNPGVPCTAATNDCLGGGTCAADQGAWTVVPFGIPNCPALGTCDPVCDVIVRKRGSQPRRGCLQLRRREPCREGPRGVLGEPIRPDPTGQSRQMRHGWRLRGRQTL